MEMMLIAGLSVLAAFMSLSVRKLNADASAFISLAAGVIVLGMALVKISDVMAVLNDLAFTAGVSNSYMQTLLKIIGLSTLAQFASQTCRDAGEDGLALKVEFAAKAILMTILVPIVISIVQIILELVP